MYEAMHKPVLFPLRCYRPCWHPTEAEVHLLLGPCDVDDSVTVMPAMSMRVNVGNDDSDDNVDCCCYDCDDVGAGEDKGKVLSFQLLIPFPEHFRTHCSDDLDMSPYSTVLT